MVNVSYPVHCTCYRIQTNKTSLYEARISHSITTQCTKVKPYTIYRAKVDPFAPCHRIKHAVSIALIR